MAQMSLKQPKCIFCCWAGALIVLIHMCFVWSVKLGKGLKQPPTSDSHLDALRGHHSWGEQDNWSFFLQNIFSHRVCRSHLGSSPLYQSRYDLVMTFQKEWDTLHHPDNVKQYFPFNSVAVKKVPVSRLCVVSNTVLRFLACGLI